MSWKRNTHFTFDATVKISGFFGKAQGSDELWALDFLSFFETPMRPATA